MLALVLRVKILESLTIEAKETGRKCIDERRQIRDRHDRVRRLAALILRLQALHHLNEKAICVVPGEKDVPHHVLDALLAEAQLFAALRSRYDLDSESDDEDSNAEQAVDEARPHLVQQRELCGGDVGRVLLADGGGQHTVVLVEVREAEMRDSKHDD